MADSKERACILILTVAGGLLRLWNLPRVGLTHFDEGIYAMAGLWTFSARGLGGLDPGLIPYAPPGYPVLVGLADLALGPSDLAAILVSVVLGTATIPVAAWIAGRTYGSGAGAVAAALAAASGMHVAFSRMALTDASFLLVWLVALAAGQRFLERPGFLRGALMGTSVGLAQLFKYNGWLAGAVVVLAAGVETLWRHREDSCPKLTRVWTFGGLGAVIAAVVYAPWYRFVETHGGYARLTAHHRSYMGGPGAWPAHWRLQMDQLAALSGGLAWNLFGWGMATALAITCLGAWKRSEWSTRGPLILGLGGIGVLAPSLGWWIGVPAVIGWKRGGPAPERVLVVAWLMLSVLTPFYHPYARLWLPLLAIGWVLAAGTIVRLAAAGGTGGTRLSLAALLLLFAACLGAGLTDSALGRPASGRSPLPGLLDPSDSLRTSVAKLVRDLPSGEGGIRLLVRPPVTFYLGGKVAASVEPNLDRLREPGTDPRLALVDLALLAQAAGSATSVDRLLDRWEVVAAYPTTPSLPTLLDHDAGAARAGPSPSRHFTLELLRPRRKEASR